MRIKYECSICGEQYNSDKQTTECEKKHDLIKKQSLIVIEEILKLYKLKGKIVLSVGSHYSDLLEFKIFENHNRIAMLSNSIPRFGSPKVKIRNTDTIENEYQINIDSLNFVLKKEDKGGYLEDNE